MDEEFEMVVSNLEADFSFNLVEKKSPNEFWVVELLEGKQNLNFTKLFEVSLFQNEKINPPNINKREAILEFLTIKYDLSRADRHEIDTANTFSQVEILKKAAIDSTFSDDEQFIQIIKSLEEISPYFLKAKELIKNPSEEKLEKAITQYSKDYFFLKNELPLLIRKPDILKEDQINFSTINENAQLALKDFIAFLNSHLFEKGSETLISK